MDGPGFTSTRIVGHALGFKKQRFGESLIGSAAEVNLQLEKDCVDLYYIEVLCAVFV